MVFINILIFLTNFAFARTQLLEFTTKQNIHNIRFLMKDNDSTFYIKGKDTLAFSSNYKSFEVIKTKTPSEFLVKSFGDSKRFLIQVKEQHHSSLNPLFNGKVYLYNLEKKLLQLIGLGVNANIHFQGKFISLFNFEKSQIEIFKTQGLIKFKHIKINSPNKYYIPQIDIFDEETILYTDINNLMVPGILKLNITTKKRTTLYKGIDPATTLEFCKDQNNKLKLFFLESSTRDDSYAYLYSIKYTEDDISKRDFLLDSKLGHAHSLMCKEDGIFMIKKVPGLINETTELIKYDPKKSKAFILSDLKFTQNYINLENEIVIPYRDKIYHLKNKKGEYTINKELVEQND